MKNIPRIFVGDNLSTGAVIPIASDVAHYLTHVMRRRDCLAFGAGREYAATLRDDNRALLIGDQTSHADPSGNITLMFAPIKRCDDLMNMATQMGVASFQPVITDRTVAAHINWTRMQKIVTEAAEQSNRNSIPTILQPVRFSELDLAHVVYADERPRATRPEFAPAGITSILIGPEGGFSDAEFAALDASGAIGVSLGDTILRAEVAAVVALARIKS